MSIYSYPTSRSEPGGPPESSGALLPVGIMGSPICPGLPGGERKIRLSALEPCSLLGSWDPLSALGYQAESKRSVSPRFRGTVGDPWPRKIFSDVSQRRRRRRRRRRRGRGRGKESMYIYRHRYIYIYV